MTNHLPSRSLSLTRGRPITLLTIRSRQFQPQIASIARALATNGVPVDAAYLDGPKRLVESDGVCHVYLGHCGARWAVPRLVRYMRRRKPRMVLAAPGFLAPFAVVAGRLAGTHVVPWERDFVGFEVSVANRYRRSTRLWLRVAEQVAYPLAPAVAVLSPDVGTHLREELGLRCPIVVLPNPIDVDEVTSHATAGTRLDRAELRFCVVARLTHGKAIDVVLDALSEASAELPPWHLDVVGDGPDGDARRMQAEALGISDRVTFHGRVDPPFRIMAAADVLIHVPRWEAFGNVLVEALALGLPVITSSCPGGPRDVVGDGKWGLVVPPNDVQSLAEALVRIASDEQLRLGLATRAPAAVARFAPSEIASRVQALAQLVESPASP